ncbi:MAG: hypothetical protein AUG51_06090 [Acidobacteria bacterium 13_1_20CM_3_53_8]|nr:MAG: hypothetical protein AUG51_06090 [Acidobacteria bacterium 13_1_20CM_3_53_8]
MQNIASNITLAHDRRTKWFAPRFAVSFLIFCLIAALLIAWRPIQLSIATVFLFAGPHNWIEFRYFLGKMPARWGRSKLFYAVGLGGVSVLTAGYVALFSLGQSWYLNETAWTVSIALWNTVMLLWLASLVHLRAKQMKRRDWSWAFAAGFALCAVAWTAPLLFSLALVYLHPLVALWFLEREIKRKRPRWLRTYHLCLAMLPLLLLFMWSQLAGAQNLSGDDALSWRITQHAGAGILMGVSSRLLVATHVFLETIHYGVWLVLIPMIGMGGSLWRTEKIPLATHRNGWSRAVRAALFLSLFVVLALWVGFIRDYTITRDIYFTFAMAHVLAEAPFLIRLL